MNDVWIDIGQKYEAMANMGCKPYGFKRVPSNFVFDEDKSDCCCDRHNHNSD